MNRWGGLAIVAVAFHIDVNSRVQFMATLEGNKIAAAVLTAGVVAMSTMLVGELIYPHPQIAENAYPIMAADDGAATDQVVAEEPALEPVGPLLASATVDDGLRVARRCSACHTFDQGGANRVGPNLWNIVNAPHAHMDGFSYSDALQAMADKPWTYEELNAFLADPKTYAPGNRMSFAGLRNVEDRAAIIVYLRSLSDSPAPLPE